MRKIIVWHKHVKSWSVPMLLWTWKWNGVTSIAYYMHIYAHLPWHFDPILSMTTPNRPHRKKEFIYILKQNLEVLSSEHRDITQQSTEMLKDSSWRMVFVTSWCVLQFALEKVLTGLLGWSWSQAPWIYTSFCDRLLPMSLYNERQQFGGNMR